MGNKIRHIDFYPDEFIAGVSGKLLPEQAGVYWMICTLIYSKSEPIDDDPKWLGNIMGGSHPRTINKILNYLDSKGKISRKDGVIMVERCTKEIAKTDERIAKATANGRQGGRPSKENNGLSKPDGLNVGKLTTNHQPITNNQQVNGYHFTDEFYPAYPNKKGKTVAETAYKRTIDKGVKHEDIMAGLNRFLADIKLNKTEKRFIPHPATWLNQGRWADEYDYKKQGASTL
jgi:uncharacterized protein YdaU (DUF1376 family)